MLTRTIKLIGLSHLFALAFRYLDSFVKRDQVYQPDLS
jgi:hypothetical protein